MPQNRKKQLNKLLRASPIYQIGEPLFQAGKKAGENLAETVLGPPDYSPVRAGRAGYNKYGTPLPKGSVDEFAEEAIDEFSPPDFGDISPEEQEAHRQRKRDRIADKPYKPPPSMALPAASMAMDTSSLTLPPMRDRSVLGPTTPQSLTDPMDTGGLDRGDPTSFKEEFEPAYVKRERERDRKRLLSQTQRQRRKR